MPFIVQRGLELERTFIEKVLNKVWMRTEYVVKLCFVRIIAHCFYFNIHTVDDKHKTTKACISETT